MVCRKCSKRIKKDTPVCPYCGAPQTETVSLGAMHEAGKKKEKKMSGKKKLTLILIYVASVLLAAGAAMLWLVGKPFSPFNLEVAERVVRFGAVILLGLGGSLLATGLLLSCRWWKRILLIVFGGLFLLSSLAAGCGLLFWREWAGAFIDDNVSRGPELNVDDLGINDVLPKTGVINIALFGLDNRTDSDDGRSDAILVLSVDRDHNKIKLTSIARDTLANVKDYGWNNNSRDDDWTKITHAFYYGAHSKDETKSGPSVAVRALNENFNLNITKYAYVNFHEFAKIIDLIGGVDIEIEQRELYQLNKHIRGMVKGSGMTISEVSSAGMQTLSGGQALAYARIRKIDSDIKRGNRQKTVIDAVLKKARTMSVLEYPSLIQEALGICNTNLTGQEILELAEWMVNNNPETVNFSLPDDECKLYTWDSYSNKGSTMFQRHGAVYVMDLEYASTYLHDFIYETNYAKPEYAQKVNQPELPTGKYLNMPQEETVPTGTDTQ